MGDVDGVVYVLNTLGAAEVIDRDAPRGWQRLRQSLALALEHGNQLPTNPKTVAKGDGVAQLARLKEWMKTAIVVDWDTINANRPAWNQRWNRNVER